MAFLGGVLKSAFNAVKSFATSGLGSMLIKGAATMFGGPLGGVLASAATNILKNGFNLKSLVQTGLDAFGGLAGKFGMSGAVANLMSAVKNPTSLLGGLGSIAKDLLGGKLSLGNVAQVAGKLLGGTKLGQNITNIVGKAMQFLGVGTKIGGDAQSAIGAISNLLGNFGVNTSGLGKVSNAIGSVLGAANKISDILGKVGGFLNPQSDAMMLRA
jgi:hypothetical protein